MSIGDTIDGIFREYDQHKDDIQGIITTLDDIGILNKSSVDSSVNQATNAITKNIAPDIAKKYMPQIIIGGLIVAGIIYLMVKKG